MTTTAQRLREALDRFEEALGGRDSLVEALLLAPPDPDRDALMGLLADPQNDMRTLGTIAGDLDFSAGEVLALFRDGERAKAQILALHEVTSQAPAVARDVMRRAQNHYRLCSGCNGTGQTWFQAEDKDGTPIGDPTKVAHRFCEGTGQILVDASLDHQKLALDMSGLISKSGPGTVVNVDASSQQLLVGALPFAQLQKAVQRVLDPPALPQLPAAQPAERVVVPVEAELVPRP
jgi:hypothetical protein